MKEAPAQGQWRFCFLVLLPCGFCILSIATFCSLCCAHFCARKITLARLWCCLHHHIWAESCHEEVSRNHNITSQRHVTASRGVNTADTWPHVPRYVSINGRGEWTIFTPIIAIKPGASVQRRRDEMKELLFHNYQSAVNTISCYNYYHFHPRELSSVWSVFFQPFNKVVGTCHNQAGRSEWCPHKPVKYNIIIITMINVSWGLNIKHPDCGRAQTRSL